MSAPSPLSEVSWEILLALAGGEKHGYAILLDVEERSGGRLRLLPGSLYRALSRLEAEGLVEEVEDAAAAEVDSRRRVVRLTVRGRRAGQEEARRRARAVMVARDRGLLAREGDRG